MNKIIPLNLALRSIGKTAIKTYSRIFVIINNIDMRNI